MLEDTAHINLGHGTKLICLSEVLKFPKMKFEPAEHAAIVFCRPDLKPIKFLSVRLIINVIRFSATRRMVTELMQTTHAKI